MARTARGPRRTRLHRADGLRHRHRRPVFGPVVTPVSGGDLDIDRTGRLVAVTGGLNGDLVTYDVDRKRMLGRLAGLPRPDEANSIVDTGAVELDGRGGVYLGSMNGPVRLVDARSMTVTRTFPRATADHPQPPGAHPWRGAGRRRGSGPDRLDTRTAGACGPPSWVTTGRSGPATASLRGRRSGGPAVLRERLRRDRGTRPAHRRAHRPTARQPAGESWKTSPPSPTDNELVEFGSRLRRPLAAGPVRAR